MPSSNSLLGTYSVDAAKDINVQPIEQPPVSYNMLGMVIARSAVEFQDALAKYLSCQCKTIEKLLASNNEEQIAPMLKSFNENMEYLYNIQTQLIKNLDKGLKISSCEEEGK